MAANISRVALATAACVVWLSGCGTSTRLGDLFQPSSDSAQLNQGVASDADPASTGSVRPTAAAAESDTVAKGPRGREAEDDLSLGKKHFRAGNLKLAERHFRRAVELHPRDLESWLGLAATYDRLKRFELADRAYDQAVKIAGPTAEILNNRGYSYMLRGDAKRARETLLDAQGKDPGNAYIKNNLELLEAGLRKGKVTQ
jgi:Flp pilus assembly protein TadD